MSGLEIVGIILGGFPVLVEAAKPISRYLQGAERWWHFKRDFMTLISTIEDESIAYSQNLELLLIPVDIDPEAKASLQEDPRSKLWHDPAIQAKLKNRIKSQYMSWFQRQLLEMRKTLDELYGMLPIDKYGKVDLPRTTTVDYELFRLKQSFSNRRQHLMENVVRINESLYKFLVKDSHIHTEATRSATSGNPAPSSNTGWSRAKTLLRLQSEAKKLSCALRTGWNCHCQHQCGVRFDWRPSETGSKEANLKLLLETGAEMKQTRVQIMTEEDLYPADTYMAPRATILDQIADLRIQARQEYTRTRAERSARRPGIAPSVLTATSTLASPAVSTDFKFWRKEQKKLTKVNQSQMLQLSAQNASGDENLSSKSTLTASAKKSVHFSLTSSDTSLVSLGHSKTWIGDVCLFLKSKPTWADRQYLRADQEAIVALSFEPRDQPGFAKSEVKDLEVFYQSTPRLPDRLQLGLEIALTILGLGTSCWIPKGWDRREVAVLRGPCMTDKPFLRHESLSFTLKETIDDTRLHTEASLFSLGVVLLELIYQETLEQQPFWDTFCDDGQPNDWTHQCTAMEWQSKVEARYGDDLSEPIRLCVEGGFSRDASLDNSGFLQEVIDTVISPLERFLFGWKRS